MSEASDALRRARASRITCGPLRLRGDAATLLASGALCACVLTSVALLVLAAGVTTRLVKPAPLSLPSGGGREVAASVHERQSSLPSGTPA